jgi:hypothetical protein
MQDENKKEDCIINKYLNKKEEYLKKKEEFRIRNKNLKDKMNTLKEENEKIKEENEKIKEENEKMKEESEKIKKENEKIKKENINVILEKIDSVASIEKYADVINNKCIFLKDKLHYDSFFTYPRLYVKFNYRNIFLPINVKKTYGFHYCYSCHYKNFEIGFKSNNFMLAKFIPNFYLNVFLYYYRRKNKLIISLDGQIKDENNNWIYLINTVSKNIENQDVQEIEVSDYNAFRWPIKHTINFKDPMFNSIDESIITISNEKINE